MLGVFAFASPPAIPVSHIGGTVLETMVQLAGPASPLSLAMVNDPIKHGEKRIVRSGKSLPAAGVKGIQHGRAI